MVTLESSWCPRWVLVVVPHWGRNRKGDGLFSRVWLIGKWFQTKRGRFRLDRWKKLIAVRHWHRFPGEVVVPHPWRHPMLGWTVL